MHLVHYLLSLSKGYACDWYTSSLEPLCFRWCRYFFALSGVYNYLGLSGLHSLQAVPLDLLGSIARRLSQLCVAHFLCGRLRVWPALVYYPCRTIMLYVICTVSEKLYNFLFKGFGY